MRNIIFTFTHEIRYVLRIYSTNWFYGYNSPRLTWILFVMGNYMLGYIEILILSGSQIRTMNSETTKIYVNFLKPVIEGVSIKSGQLKPKICRITMFNIPGIQEIY
jgi:hypothetical protein